MSLITVPSASTAVTPASCDLVGPYLIVRIPPAFVAIVPPTVAESRDARSTPYRSPARAACADRLAMLTPAPAVTWPAAMSTGPRWSSRERESMTGAQRPACCGGGTDPPTRLVLPPCGTTGTPRAAHARSAPATSPAERGRTTQLAAPR